MNLFIDLDASLESHREMFEDFRLSLVEFFDHVTNGKTYKRKPSQIGLRIPIPGDPKGLLAINPDWSRFQGCHVPGTVILEVLTEKNGATDLWRVSKGYRPVSIRLELSPTQHRFTGWSRDSEEGFDRLVSKVIAIQQDPEGAMGDIHCDHCRRCGRILTDAVSMMRGYGPECANHMEYLIKILQRIAAQK